MSGILFNLESNYKNNHIEIVFSESFLLNKKEFLNYLYSKSYLLEHPKNEYCKAEILIRINLYHYSENILECKGYSPNILMSSYPIFQKWSLSVKIFTENSGLKLFTTLQQLKRI